MKTINIGDKFVACWGYDQTQYSIYNVVEAKGKSVLVEGLNGWSSLDENDLAAGSQVKIYNFTPWDDLSEVEQKDLESRHFTRWNYDDWKRKDAIDAAPVRTIVKRNLVNGEKYTYKWLLDNGQEYDSTENWKTRGRVKIVKAMKKCLVRDNGDYAPSIRIDQCITAYHDLDYNKKADKYAEQNLYTAYNGR